MDPSKLERLRQRFSDTAPDEIEDPDFKTAHDVLFTPDGRRFKPWEGVATFMDLPLMADGPDDAGFADLDVAVIGCELQICLAALRLSSMAAALDCPRDPGGEEAGRDAHGFDDGGRRGVGSAHDARFP